MDSVYLKKAREASCKVIDLYITSITFLFCDMLQANEALPPLNKERFDPLKADALDKLKEAINHEADLYDSIPEDEIMDYKEIDEGNYGQVRFI